MQTLQDGLFGAAWTVGGHLAQSALGQFVFVRWRKISALACSASRVLGLDGLGTVCFACLCTGVSDAGLSPPPPLGGWASCRRCWLRSLCEHRW